MAGKFQENEDERSPERKGDLEAERSDVAPIPQQQWKQGAGHGAEFQRLSPTEEASDESTEELADENQDLEAESVAGVEDAGDHPERPTHTHTEYGRTDDLPPAKREDEAA